MNNAERLVINCIHLPNKSMNLSSSGVVESVRLSAFQHLGNSRLLLLANSSALACACSSTSNSEEQCTAPNVLSSGVCGGYLWCTNLHVLLPPLETLSSQILQQALLSLAAFTEKCFYIPLVTRLAIVTECTCAQSDSLDRAIIGNRINNRYSIPHHYLVSSIPIPIPVSVEH